MHRSTLAFVFVVAACGDNFEGNAPPTVDDLVLTTDEDTPLTRTLDVADREGDAVTITLEAAAHGTVTAGTGGSFTYTPNANYAGPDSFQVRVSDGRLEARGTVSITVAPVNDAPTGIADAFATSEDMPHTAAASALLANDTDVDGDTLAITDVGDATSGTVAIVGTDVVFTPFADFIGTGTYRYTVSDGTATANVSVTITIGGVNDPPVAADDTATTAEDTDLVVAATTLLANDADPEGQTLTVTAVTAVTGGTVALAGGDVTFTPAANFNGAASFTYTVSDGQDTDTGTVDVTVTPVNDAPTAVADTATTAEDTAVTVLSATMLANDTDAENDALAITAAANAVNGTLAFAGGDVTFTPTANFTGAGSFEYTVFDGTASSTGTVTVTITAVNDPPVAIDDMVTTNEDTAANITSATLLANDIDIDGDALAIASVSNATNGSVVLGVGGTITFTPNAGFVGTASFDYVVDDGTATDTGSVSVIVVDVNNAPVATDDTGTTDEDTAFVVAESALLANDTDADGDTLTVTAVGTPVNGTVSRAGGDVTFVPAANFAGIATFEYTVSDGNGATDVGTVTVTVTALNDAPVANPETVTVAFETATDFAASAFLANDTDADADTLTITAVANAANGAVAQNGTTITFTPATGFTGVAGFEYTVSDGNGGTATGVVTVNVINCGNGVVEQPELCDDGGTNPGDGCGATCQPEAGWSCTGQPSTCTTTCGDTITAGTEQCDDGDADDTDGCTTQCVIGVACNATDIAGADRFATDPGTGTCYASFDAEQTTFAGAQAACVASGGHLATITSSGENALVHSVQNAAENPWIGASEDANDTDAVFDWVTTEAFGFTDFATGQPDDDVGDGGNGDCLHLFNAAGQWNDTNCNIDTFVRGRICELAVDTCGDGIVQTVNNELCDDGNQANGDGCSSTCTLETFVRFSFTGAAGNDATFAADTTPATLAAAPAMSRGTGLTPSAAANAFSANNFTLSATLDVDDYYAFTVTPNANVTMKLLALELDERRSSTGIRSWSIRSSLDNFATDLGTFSVPDNDLTRGNQRVFLGPAFAALTTAVEFRIYGFAAEATTGTWRIDNVELSGAAQ